MSISTSRSRRPAFGSPHPTTTLTPAVYSSSLAKLIGPYATLGLAEDTWAVNERVLDERGFLEQAYLYHEERRKMWFHALNKLRKGMVCCVFDLSDRLQPEAG